MLSHPHPWVWRTELGAVGGLQKVLQGRRNHLESLRPFADAPGSFLTPLNRGSESYALEGSVISLK